MSRVSMEYQRWLVWRARQVAGSLACVQRLIGVPKCNLRRCQNGIKPLGPRHLQMLEWIANESIEPEKIQRCATTKRRSQAAKQPDQAVG